VIAENLADFRDFEAVQKAGRCFHTGGLRAIRMPGAPP
jgi:hypothetical protein